MHKRSADRILMGKLEGKRPLNLGADGRIILKWLSKFFPVHVSKAYRGAEV
jgi:hypothetical protein